MSIYYHKSVIAKSSSSRSMMSSIRLLKKKLENNSFIHSNNNYSFVSNKNSSTIMEYSHNPYNQQIPLKNQKNKSTVAKQYNNIDKDKPFYESLFRFPQPKSGYYSSINNVPRSRMLKSINKSLIAKEKLNVIINKLGLIKKVYDHVYPITIAQLMCERQKKARNNIKQKIEGKMRTSSSTIYSIADWNKKRKVDLGSKYPKKNHLNKTSWGTFYQHKKMAKSCFE